MTDQFDTKSGRTAAHDPKFTQPPKQGKVVKREGHKEVVIKHGRDG